MAKYWLTDVPAGYPVSDKSRPPPCVSPLPSLLTCHSGVDAAHPLVWRRRSVASAAGFISCLRYFYPPPPENPGPPLRTQDGSLVSGVVQAKDDTLASGRQDTRAFSVRQAGSEMTTADKMCSSCWVVDCSSFWLDVSHLGSNRNEMPPCGWLWVLHFCSASLHF